MEIQHIILNDAKEEHRELAIWREGEVNEVRLSDPEYKVYRGLGVSAHNHTALFHYGVVEALNRLQFISESGHGLDSWDEAFLPVTLLPKMTEILEECLEGIEPGKTERVMLGWHEEPVAVAYWRVLSSDEARRFLQELMQFAREAAAAGHDLEWIL